MFIAAFIDSNQNVKATQVSFDRWINKMWYMYTMIYYSTLKKKETLQYATTWMILDNIMLSEISQTQGQMLMIALT